MSPIFTGVSLKYALTFQKNLIGCSDVPQNLGCLQDNFRIFTFKLKYVNQLCKMKVLGDIREGQCFILAYLCNEERISLNKLCVTGRRSKWTDCDVLVKKNKYKNQ